MLVRAIDVGFGAVKFVKKVVSGDPRLVCGQFPSHALIAQAQADHRRDTVLIGVGDRQYEVGPDSYLAQGTYSTTVHLDPAFALSDGYLARVRGALHYMRRAQHFDYLDLLVLGLPVKFCEGLREPLIQRMRGSHGLPDGA